jgi:prephenate dehydrogenase
MRVLVLGAGKMGTFLADVLGVDHEVAILDRDPARLRFTYNCVRLGEPREIAAFDPAILVNAATLRYTIDAFRQALPFLSPACLLADIASVKTGLESFYRETGRPFVSSHPMFGPTFANLANLSSENAIIIAESDPAGKAFFRDLYAALKLNIFEYSFEEHDEMIAYSLSIPFASTLVFAAVMRHQEAPGTTFKKHMAIARGLLSEDDYLLAEILFNPRAPDKLQEVCRELSRLLEITRARDSSAMEEYLRAVRRKIE